MYHSLSSQCIIVFVTKQNYANVQKLYNNTSKSELDDFDMILFDNNINKNELPTISFQKSDIPDNFVTDFVNPKCY
jgi:hypothetical protein